MLKAQFSPRTAAPKCDVIEIEYRSQKHCVKGGGCARRPSSAVCVEAVGVVVQALLSYVAVTRRVIGR